MTTYFPVSVEQLREHCRYNADHNSYEYEMIYASPYPPFGEVVDSQPRCGIHKMSLEHPEGQKIGTCSQKTMRTC